MPGPPFIRVATPADAERLADLAEQTFRDTFAADNSTHDMDAHVRESFSQDRVRIELLEDENRFLLAFVDDAERPAGMPRSEWGRQTRA